MLTCVHKMISYVVNSVLILIQFKNYAFQFLTKTISPLPYQIKIKLCQIQQHKMSTREGVDLKLNRYHI